VPETDKPPESGKMIDIIIRIVVVLPAPFGPMKPHSAARDRGRGDRRLGVEPNVLVTP
jgi:hypothetical protein